MPRRPIALLLLLSATSAIGQIIPSDADNGRAAAPNMPSPRFQWSIHDLFQVVGRSPEAVRVATAAFRSAPILVADAVRKNTDDCRAADPAVRRRAVERLHRLGAFASPALGELEYALRDDEVAVRRAAARAIGTPEAARVVETGEWIDDLSSGASETRLAAVRKLRDAKFADDEMMALVAQAMTHDDWLLREGPTPTSRAYLNAALKSIAP